MSAPHWSHDIHGPLIYAHPDGSFTVDEDCDCEPDCAGCVSEGVDRGGDDG